jgi:signal transduction histidine kinase
MTRWSAASVRVRLTAWYAGILTLVLLVYTAAAYLAVRHALLEQFDRELRDTLESARADLRWTTEGGLTWLPGSRHGADGDLQRALDVWSVNGEPLYRSRSSLQLAKPLPTSGAADGAYQTIDGPDGHWRTLTAATTVDGRAVVARAAGSEAQLQSQVEEIFFVLTIGLPFAVALAGAAGYVFARRALAPIEASFDQLRRFTADASHELRTPLAVMRGTGEAAVADRRSPAEYEDAIGSMLEEVDRLSRLVDTLLRLARADAGTMQLSRQSVDLGQLAREVAASLSLLSDGRRQTIALETDDGVVLSGDRLMLREALTNVLDNAIAHGPEGSTVGIAVTRDGARATISVADEGPGVPDAHRQRIFDRFFRVDDARSRDRGGVGLGLAIARSAVEAHHGTISVHARSGGGAEFRIELPLE